MRRELLGVAATLVAGSLVLTGCGGDDKKKPAAKKSEGDVTATAAPTERPDDKNAAPGPSDAPSDGPPTATALGPDGYGALKLGMSLDQAKATGLITVKKAAGGCTAFDLKAAPPAKGAVGGYVSAKLGVSSIFSTEEMRTPQGIGNGSTLAELKQAFPKVAKKANVMAAKVPDNPKAEYDFVLGEGGKTVDQVALVLPGQTCHN
ncbi:hypothetical protein [Actinomadura macrotermitis]|uniref:Lipoprotein n=1 Tax=Actinomadura macrotermitis TaxID=2585200 RepID=A0A7K0BTQ2_9ACTN|nr:hypothetical protein [Actinomadura macrotermitis]MQY04573.1 hypothetical protein [Actinomadura macrotermitis]